MTLKPVDESWETKRRSKSGHAGRNYVARSPNSDTVYTAYANNLTAERSNPMGLVYADIELINGSDLILQRQGYLNAEEVRSVKLRVLVDSGALMLTINQEIKLQLGLQKVDERAAQLADGTMLDLEVVGPIEIRFENRRSNVDAMVLPGDNEPLLGAIPMEDMDVLVDPQQRRLVVNPEHPYMIQHSLK